MDKRTHTKIIVFILLAALIIAALVYHNIIAIRQGEVDYALIADGKLPLYAKKYAAASDGGTICYKGNGYSVYCVHSLYQKNGVGGYLIGPRIRYSPFVLAGRNKESLRFEADIENKS
jgi:hypothetical protein